MKSCYASIIQSGDSYYLIFTRPDKSIRTYLVTNWLAASDRAVRKYKAKSSQVLKEAERYAPSTRVTFEGTPVLWQGKVFNMVQQVHRCVVILARRHLTRGEQVALHCTYIIPGKYLFTPSTAMLVTTRGAEYSFRADILPDWI